MGDEFYEALATTVRKSTPKYIFVIGDFNAKAGKKQEGNKHCIGQYSIGQGNGRVNLLINFTEAHKNYIINLFNKKGHG